MVARALPPPLISDPSLDLRKYDWFPLYGDRLLPSDFVLQVSDEVLGVSVKLWCHAWKQVPAASLPNNDRVIASMLGRDLDSWRKLKRTAMAAWVLCTDDRWYHPTMVKVALERAHLRERWRNNKVAQRSRFMSSGTAEDMPRTASTSTSTSSPSDSVEAEAQQIHPGKESTESQVKAQAAGLSVIEGGR